jgi:uncharacterized protein (DUF427 family)
VSKLVKMTILCNYVVIVDHPQHLWYLRYYAEPKAEASNIKGRVAFWKGVQVSP